jgi:hypothetical protein
MRSRNFAAARLADPASTAGPTTYSTGGGGTVLEHRFGAVVLSHVLARTPMPALGDHVTAQWVRFQARGVSPVDDILVAGTAPNGAPRHLAIGVRRTPKLTAGDPDSVKLIASYLDTVAQQWSQLSSGRARLALAVVPSCRPALELKALADVAGDSEPEFRRRMQDQGRPNQTLRRRLDKLDDLVRAACDTIDHAGIPATELTWRLLSRLSLIELRLEGADVSDRSMAVELFSRLSELVGTYAPSGARVTLDRLHADLHGLPFFTSRRHTIPPTPATPARPVRPSRAKPSPEAVEAWSRPMPSAEARQPLVCEDTVVVQDRYRLLAFDAHSGEALWNHGTAFPGAPVLGDASVYLPAGPSATVLVRDLRSGRTRRPELTIRMRDGLAAAPCTSPARTVAFKPSTPPRAPLCGPPPSANRPPRPRSGPGPSTLPPPPQNTTRSTPSTRSQEPLAGRTPTPSQGFSPGPSAITRSTSSTKASPPRC